METAEGENPPVKVKVYPRVAKLTRLMACIVIVKRENL